jgi:3-oxoadipate enol-lactonase
MIKTIPVRDGTKIAYRLTAGSGKGKARFALLHSLAMDGAFWDRVAACLHDDGDVLAIDCRGHGRSDKPAGPYSAELFADDLADVMDKIGWSKAIVAGASMGGCVSLAFTEAYPDRVEGLGLIDTTAGYRAPAAWEERAQKAQADGIAVLVDFQKSRWLSDKFRADHPEIVEEAVSVFLANDLAAFVETCRMLGRFDKHDALSKIEAPTAIMVGSEDYATPVAMAETLHQGIKGSSFAVTQGVRHLTPLECPEIVAATLRGLVGH